MPGIDGFKLASVIRSIENVWNKELSNPGDIREPKSKNKVKIVAITANDIDTVKDQAKKVGI